MKVRTEGSDLCCPMESDEEPAGGQRQDTFTFRTTPPHTHTYSYTLGSKRVLGTGGRVGVAGAASFHYQLCPLLIIPDEKEPLF